MGPEHVSSIIPRALNGQPAQGAHVPSTPALSPASGRARTLPELVEVFRADEARDNPDVVTTLSSLRLTDEGFVDVPKLGFFAMTEWSRRQIATALGVRWNVWFENASSRERADETNRRFARASGLVRLRTRALQDPDPVQDKGLDGHLRALVSATYTPVPDSTLARHLVEALRPGDAELRLVRQDMTDRTSTYVVKLGDVYRPGDAGSQVGDVWGGVLVRNSGVGFASLVISLFLTRLSCLNGMTAPVQDPFLMKRRHRGIDDHALRALLAERLLDLPGRLHQGQMRLRAAAEKKVDDVPGELRHVLEHAGLPQRHMPALLSAYGREPLPNAFGVSQAITLAAQSMSPEERLELEQAAGRYLTLN